MERQAFNETQDKDPIASLISKFGDLVPFHDQAASRPAAQPESLPALTVHDKEASAALDKASLGAVVDRSASDNDPKHGVVIVDKTDHKTHVLKMHDGKIEDVLTVPNATGREPKMTPEGLFHITQKIVDPTWTPPPSMKGAHKVEAGPNNPLGPRALRTDADNGLILLHGTNMPESVGHNASHGCIRHNNKDIQRLFPLINKGDEVYITRDFKATLGKLSADDFR
jgi:lipoprotein-anchoring transpeptidase ErfK/SrfK